MTAESEAFETADNTLPQKQDQTEPTQATTDDNAAFPIVAVGASAGGLSAFETFFDNLPDQPEMAFVLIQHLDPHHESELAQILQNHTRMPVAQVQDRQKIRVNNVYVIPPGQSLSVENGTLYLSPPTEPRGRRHEDRPEIQIFATDLDEDALGNDKPVPGGRS